MRVAVVGAGFAGLACAADLAGAGIDVTVFEASDRVGGRVWSDVMPDGARFERGGEFVEAGYDDLRRRAAAFGLPLAAQGFEFGSREVRADGRVLPDLLHQAEQVIVQTTRDLGAEAQRISAADALARAPLAPLARLALTRRLEGTYTVELERVSAAWLASVELRAADVGEVALHAWPGATTHSPGHSRPSSPAVCASAARSTSCARKRRGAPAGAGVDEHFDRAVLAVPLPLALALLPALRERAGYGGCRSGSRASCTSRSPSPWIRRGAGARGGVLVVDRERCGGGPATVASAFAGGARADGDLELAHGSDRWLAALQVLRPELRPAGEAVLTRWEDEQYSGGSYACHPPGWSRQDDEDVAAPHGRVHLAGEHTAAEFCGTFEGALRSGARAAAEVLAERYRTAICIDLCPICDLHWWLADGSRESSIDGASSRARHRTSPTEQEASSSELWWCRSGATSPSAEAASRTGTPPLALPAHG